MGGNIRLPTVRRLRSIIDFRVYQATELLGGGAAPYDYIDILDVGDAEDFNANVASPAMKQLAGEFADWADAIFITTREISEQRAATTDHFSKGID